MDNSTLARVRRIAETAARAGVAIHPRYIIAVIDGRKC